MSKSPKDPLLLTSRIILAFLMGLMAFVGAICALVVPILLVMHGKVSSELAAHGINPTAAWAIPLLVGLVAIGAGLGFLFFRNLFRMVGTVGDGDPFIAENATRLRDMGWIVIAANVLVIAIAASAHWVDSLSDHVHADMDFDISGILLALVLFILARVFREGTRMREELEGTV